MKFHYKERIFFDKGYRISEDGIYYNHKGKEIKGCMATGGYIRITTSYEKKKIFVLAHRLVAYQKYGETIYNEEIEVRHLDENPKNNRWDNIALGTHSDNMMDVSKEVRIKKASNANKKYSDELAQEIREYHLINKSYNDTMEKYNITSKGTLYHILKKRL